MAGAGLDAAGALRFASTAFFIGLTALFAGLLL
jgi:hypothetical protein